MKKIAELLPEGLTEETLDQIASLVDETIDTQVTEQVKAMNAKVSAFLRLKMDAIKEQALKELEAENEDYRKAKLFEEVKTVLAMDITQKDADSEVTALVTQNKELTEEVELLAEELSNALEKNSELYEASTSLAKRVKIVESALEDVNSEKEMLEEAVKEAEDKVEEPFHSSEQALVITENSDKQEERQLIENDFLSTEVMRLMPHKS